MAIILSQADIAALKRYRNFIQRYYVDFEDHLGITRPLDHEGNYVDGALCLSTGKAGPTLAINAMMHKNEPAGIAAQMDLVERWEKGDRPKAGTVILTLGTPPQIVTEFLDNVISKAERGEAIDNDAGHHVDYDHLQHISEAVYLQTHGKILDIHSTASTDEPMLLPYLPRNTLKEEIGIGKIMPELNADQAYLASQALVSTSLKIGSERAFDDDYSEEMINDVTESYSNSRHDLEGTARDMCEHINGMPVRHVLADYCHGILASSLNHFMLNHILRYQTLDGIPTVLETGGANLHAHHHSVAVACARAFTHNILHWPPHIPMLSGALERYYYTDATSVVRPHAGNSDNETHQKESYLLLHDAASIPDALKAKADINWDKITSGRLNSFAPIQCGDPIAIGEVSGNIIRAHKDGFVAITPASRIDAEYAQDTAVAIIASERTLERDIIATETRGRC